MAQVILGHIYEESHDYAKAMEWYEKAATKNDELAEHAKEMLDSIQDKIK